MEALGIDVDVFLRIRGFLGHPFGTFGGPLGDHFWRISGLGSALGQKIAKNVGSILLRHAFGTKHEKSGPEGPENRPEK